MKFSYRPTSYSDVAAPFLDLQLSDPLGDRSKQITCLVDTGYNGDIIVPISVFQELGLESYELSSDYFSIAERIAGEELRLLSAYGTVSLPDLELTIETVGGQPQKIQGTLGDPRPIFASHISELPRSPIKISPELLREMKQFYSKSE